MKHSATNLTVLIAVIIASVMSVLALSTAYAQLKIAERFARYETLTQENTNRAHSWLIDSMEEEKLQETENLTESFSDEAGHFLKISLKKENGRITIAYWVYGTEWSENIRTEHYIQQK